jgi:hypothetical protein
MFATHELIEIDMTSFHAIARVRDIDGARLHVALEPGSYLPWIDAPAFVRRTDSNDEPIEARIISATMTTALLELRLPAPTAAPPQGPSRDTVTDEAVDVPRPR